MSLLEKFLGKHSSKITKRRVKVGYIYNNNGEFEIPEPKGELKTNWKLLYRLDVFKTRNKKRVDIVARDFRYPTCERRAYFTFWGEDEKIVEALLHFINEYCNAFMKLANKNKKSRDSP